MEGTAGNGTVKRYKNILISCRGGLVSLYYSKIIVYLFKRVGGEGKYTSAAEEDEMRT